jgi:hypothetical protein
MKTCRKGGDNYYNMKGEQLIQELELNKRKNMQ